jgi:hypothetical protein
MGTQGSVFVSYAHEDRVWADELALYLAPRIRERKLRLWDDRQIPAGADWQATIQDALAGATVSVILVTQALLASSFVADVEIPAILDLAARDEMRLIWVAVNHSTVDQSPLSQYQAANNPAKPLAALSKADRAKAWVEIAEAIDNAGTLGSFASALAILDDTTETLEAVVQGRPEDTSRTFRVMAAYEPSNDRIAFHSTRQTITYDDLDRLPADDREFIQHLEESLRDRYSSYLAAKKRIGVFGDVLNDEAERELRRIGKLMCDDLVSILDFLKKIHKYDLEDHYNRYRYICSELQRNHDR